MTPLRQRMLDAMTVRGLAERTQECYAEAVSRMARHYHRSPDLLSPAEVEAYFPPRQNSCRLDRTKNPGAAMKDDSGTIRTSIQRQSGSQVAAI